MTLVARGQLIRFRFLENSPINCRLEGVLILLLKRMEFVMVLPHCTIRNSQDKRLCNAKTIISHLDSVSNIVIVSLWRRRDRPSTYYKKNVSWQQNPYEFARMAVMPGGYRFRTRTPCFRVSTFTRPVYRF